MLTVAQAHDVASVKEKKVTVAGYYISHFEGDTLEMQPGDQTARGVPLEFGLKFTDVTSVERTAVHTMGGHYDQRYVFVTGMLKRGPLPGAHGVLLDCVFIDVETIRVPENPPMRPKAYRQFEVSHAKKS